MTSSSDRHIRCRFIAAMGWFMRGGLWMFTPSSLRVPKNTAEHINKKISDEAAKRVACCAAGGHAAIDARLRELDREWDIERVIGTVAPTGILVGLTLGLTKNRKFFA